MTSFVESCVQTLTESATAAQRRQRRQPTARRLIRLLAQHQNILITTHMHPDPDALASAMALAHLLRSRLHESKIVVSVKGRIGGGLNDTFTREASIDLIPWDESTLGFYDAIVLLDTQPGSAYCPLPRDRSPQVVIDHHRRAGRKPKGEFVDIRTDVGATTSIIFSYLMEMEETIDPKLAATMLYAIESDLAGAAGTPGELDNVALSSLTTLADTSRLYRMRYVRLQKSYYESFAKAIGNAVIYGNGIISFLGEIDSAEKPAVLADFLLRYDSAEWALVSGVYNGRLTLSLRSYSSKIAVSDIIHKLVKNIGEGGGHRTKAGGSIALETTSDAEVERIRAIIRRRMLSAMKLRGTRGTKLV